MQVTAVSPKLAIIAGHRRHEMRQWEYLRLDLNAVPRRGNEMGVLNGAGSDGWELAAINRNGVAILKREIGQPVRAVRRKGPEPIAR